MILSDYDIRNGLILFFFSDVDPKALYNKDVFDNAKVIGGEGGILNSSGLLVSYLTKDSTAVHFPEWKFLSKIKKVINPGMLINSIYYLIFFLILFSKLF